MTLENQVCSPELAKKLKELGVEQESCFYWGHQMINIGGTTSRTGTELYNHKYGNALIPEASAFTVAELGEMLPREYFTVCLKNGQWCAGPERANEEVYQYAGTEADARAKMLIYLLENNLITPS